MKLLKLTLPIIVFIVTLSIWGARAANDKLPPTETAVAKTDPPAQPQLTSVVVITPSSKEVGSITVLGTVKAAQESRIIPNTAGQIVRSYVKEGDKVAAGQLLFELGGVAGAPHPLLLQMDLAQSTYQNSLSGLKTLYDGNDVALRIAQLQLQAARAQNESSPFASATPSNTATTQAAENALQMAQEGYRAALIKNRGALLQTQAQIDAARMNYEMARTQYDALAIKAPFAGIVKEVSANEGDVVGPQLPVATVISNRGLELVAQVTAADAKKIKIGSAATVVVGDTELRATVKKVALVVDPVTKLVAVTIAFPQANVRINETLTARIDLRAGLAAFAQKSVFIPLDAVIIGTEETYVFVFEDGVSRKKTVAPGALEGDRAEILEGLTASEQVILNSKQLLDGQFVAIESAS